MKFVTITPENIEKEHICCILSNKKGDACVASKKTWIKERFSDGLVFKKLDVRGKVFIEYLPAEQAWYPIIAPNYMHINCFWVSGQYQGKGYANQLLDQCIADAKAKGKCGLSVLSSRKKLPFLSDPNYLKHKGFLIGDMALSSFELLYFPFDDPVCVPQFHEQVKKGGKVEKGLVVYYSHQCPHTAKYVPLMVKIANQYGVEIHVYKIETAQQAQQAPSPWTTYSLYHHGVFVTNAILSEKKFKEMLIKWGYVHGIIT